MSRWLGLAGVHPLESARAKAWSRWFELPVIFAAAWLPLQWHLEATGELPREAGRIGDWVIWALFLSETVVVGSLVRDRRRYLANNWLNLVIIVGGFPLLWGLTPLLGTLRMVRLVLMAGLLLRLLRATAALLGRNSLGATLLVSLVIIIASGVLISRMDPNIATPWDGIWWAWVTVTTVGYGDVVPVGGPGRLFAALLILLGVGLFSLLTANFSAFLIGRGVREMESEFEKDVEQVGKDMELVERDEMAIIETLGRIEGRLGRIEGRLAELDRHRSSEIDSRG